MSDISQFRADVLLNKLLSNLPDLQNSLTVQSQFLVPGIVLVAVFVILYLLRKFFQIKRLLNEPTILFELTPPSFTEQEAYTTDQLFSVIHALGNQRPFKDRLLGLKPRFSLEIVSTQSQGIRYIVRTSPKQVNILKKSLLSYLPHLNVKTTNEYLPVNTENLKNHLYKVLEFKLSKHFAFSLKKQSELDKHDPIAYITGMMTKLAPSELISLQIVLTPAKRGQIKKIQKLLSLNGNVVSYLKTSGLLKGLLYNSYTVSQTKSPSEQEAVRLIDTKINQQLFESTIRLLIISKTKEDLTEREQGLKSSLSTFASNGYQSINAKRYLNIGKVRKFLFYCFRKRLLSFTGNSLLGISEVSGIYHFPFTSITKTENLVKNHSKTLPAPLSLKKGNKLDVVFGKNNYGGTTTEIGLTGEERETHMYILGRTGSGKTTMMFSMAKHDIEQGRGLCFVDPHGDAAEDLVSVIPEKRLNDLIYINPIDLKYPIGINILELTEGLDEDEAELEKEVVCEGVISLFRKVFSKEENTNAHRIEYILRNAIYTAFTVEDRTIFTVHDLLNNPKYLKSVLKTLDDEDLQDFWKNEFGRAGDYQIVKMVGGVTAKIGRFLFSPIAKRILEQEKSTINFSDILNGKILICNLSQGKLGEDTSRLLGTTILTKIQQAALRRAVISEDKRKQFHLYVDEFQDFATLSFVRMLTRIRKYGVDVCMAEQSTSQQQDKDIVNIILANITTMICFRTGNPEDEDLMLAQFYPYVQKGEIMNLPRYKFYIKISAILSEPPFSGETIKIQIKKNLKKIKILVETSRRNWAIVYKNIQKKITNNDQTIEKKPINTSTNRLPKKKR